jgi:hypothetical protein
MKNWQLRLIDEYNRIAWGSLYKSPFDPPRNSVPITPIKKVSLREIWRWYDRIVPLTVYFTALAIGFYLMVNIYLTAEGIVK